MTINRYDLVAPVQGLGYEALLEALAELAVYCSLTVRDSDTNNQAVHGALSRLAPYQMTVERTFEWPGTRLFGHRAELHTYAMGPELIARLKEETSDLFGWLTPALPEDLCLYRADKSCVLATIAHERDAYLEVSVEELARLKQAVPGLEVA